MNQYEFLETNNALKEKIKGTINPTVNFNLERVECELWDSKLGGDPYLEIGEEYPKSESGKEHRLLAQINFEQMPRLEGFPEKGLLQFFIEPNHYYGLDFSNRTKQDTFKVKYIKDIIKDKSKLITDFSFLKELEDRWFLPFRDNGKIIFSNNVIPVVPEHETIGRVYKDIELDNEEEYYELDIMEQLEEVKMDVCKVGGYPFFTQEDPREEGSKYDTLLLQLAMEDVCKIMFADGGVGNFLINSEELKNCDFSNVMYDWSCN